MPRQARQSARSRASLERERYRARAAGDIPVRPPLGEASRPPSNFSVSNVRPSNPPSHSSSSDSSSAHDSSGSTRTASERGSVDSSNGSTATASEGQGPELVDEVQLPPPRPPRRVDFVPAPPRVERRRAVAPDNTQHAASFENAMRRLNFVACLRCRKLSSSFELGGANVCLTCRRTDFNLFSSENGMDLGAIPPELRDLTLVEELLIARVHPVVSVFKIRGQQMAYSGHVMNFNQYVERIATRLPHDPRSLSAILLLNKETCHGLAQFKVRARRVSSALVWLQQNNHYYRDIVIDDALIRALPLDGDVSQLLPGVQRLEEGEVDGEQVQHNNLIDRSCYPSIPAVNAHDMIRRRLNREGPEIDFGDWPDVSQNMQNEFNNEGLICKAFPVLFPYGRGDLNAPRLRTINRVNYFKYLMLYRDGRFARDSRFPYYAYNSLARWSALSAGNVYVRMHQFEDLNAQDIADMLEDPEQDVAANIMYYGASLRGTRPYWKQRCSELIQMVRQLGTPTIFFTLSAADYHWPDLFRILCPGHDPVTLSERQRLTLMHDNPLIVAWFFRERVEKFISSFMIPLFNVKDHWYRYEWQHRGSPHTHGLLWLNDVPENGDLDALMNNDDARQQIVEYFDRYVSACINARYSIDPRNNPCRRRLSDLTAEERLNDLDRVLSAVQIHSRCGQHCLRKARNSRVRKCRYGFPMVLEPHSRLGREDGVWKFIPRRNNSLLQRYNPLVSQVWRGNTDFSPITSQDAVLNYISKYASKGEQSSAAFSDILRHIIDRNDADTEAATLVRQLLISSVAERNYSAQEVMHLLLGWPLYRASRQMVVLSIKDEWNRVGAGRPSIPFTRRYAQRPQHFNDVCLFDFAKRHYFRGDRILTRHHDAVVRVIPYLKQTGDEIADEDYFMYQCKLYIPWRERFEDLRDENETWHDVYLRIEDNPGRRNQFGDELPPPDELEFEPAPNDYGYIVRDAGMAAARIAPNIVNRDPLGERPIDEAQIWPDLAAANLTEEGINLFLRSCNAARDDELAVRPRITYRDMSPAQRRVLDVLAAQISYLNARQPIQSQNVVKRVIVQGKAGTGKSAVIHAMCFNIHSASPQRRDDQRRQKAYIVLAPTGAAAINVNGKTLHSFLRIPVNGPLVPLAGESLRSFQLQFSAIRFVIIDEYSMIGMRMLHKIHLRLCEAKGSTRQPFGGYFIYLLGDLRQLPPVRDLAIYMEPSDDFSRMSIALIQSFTTRIVLNVCHRQAASQERFIQTLDRIAVGRVQQSDWELLMSRRTNLQIQNRALFSDAIHLYPNNNLVQQHNTRVLENNGLPVCAIQAAHNNATARQASPLVAQGLQSILFISVNCRIMLRKNINVDRGLVNGSLGTVREIVYGDDQAPPSMPYALLIEFDRYPGPYLRDRLFPLLPIVAKWRQGNVDCVRKQFPINLAYALTIHKAQGLTLDRAIVDIGDREMAVGLTYVALSRVKRLDDLVIWRPFDFTRLLSIGNMQHVAHRERFLNGIEAVE